MRKSGLLVTILLALLACHPAIGQDFSNKGKDFWVIYTGHIDGTTSRMALYITSDQNATGTVSVAGSVINFTVTANQVTTIRLTNTSTPSNSLAYNGQTTGIGTNKGIHIVTDHPVVVYSHILNSARSGSTLVLPTNVLGREYYVSTYKSVSGGGGNMRRSEFAIVASQDNTTVEITPAVADADNTHPAGTAFQVTLNTGDVFQYQSANDNDLTGTYIKSIATATSPCKPIAVYAGSTWTALGCATASSGDNLYQQLFPLVSWGKEYITAPFILRSYDIFRVLVKDPTTVVQVNGVTLSTATLISNAYYEFSTSGNNTPRIITSDKPICVVQYMITQNCDGVNSDPEMIILNSVEQTLNDITVLSARNDLTPPNTNITRHFLNIIVKTSALGSLRVDGASYTATPVAIPSTQYSYLQEEVTTSTVANPAHRITCDSGFLAIAYGYGNVESYGYNAGTNVRDLYQFVSVQNQYATVNFPAACKGSPFYFSMTFPYQPTQITWDFSGLFSNVTINSPVYDSTWIVNGKQLYRYRLANPYTINTTGTFPIKVFAQNPTPDGCSGQQEINYDLQVFAPPISDFTISNNGGCVTDTVYLNDASNLNGRAAIKWHWDFGDTGIDSVRNTKHKYAAPGSYTIKYSLITDIGCLSDTATKIVNLTAVPVSKFGISTPYCAGRLITFSDSSTTTGGATLVKWYWDFGDGATPVVTTSNASQTHIYTGVGTFNVTLKVETTTGCQSDLFTFPLTIHPNPLVNFSLPNVCLPAGTAQFNDLSTISDGTQTLFSYQWNFGDAGTAAIKDPLHNYTGLGPYNVTLTVTSGNGCIHDTTRILSTIYAEPQAAFNAPVEVCFGAPVNLTDLSTAANSTVTQWNWDFGDGTTSALQNPVKNYTAPGTYIIKLSVTSAIGCQTINNTATKTVVVNPLPTAAFNTSAPVCETRDITFTDASLANAGTLVKWTWNFGDGNNSVLATASPFTHVYAAAGNYTAALQVETNKGCVSALLTKPLVINPVPLAGYISPEICLTDPIAPFVDTSHIASGSIVSWSWNFGDPNATTGNPNTSVLQNPGHRYITVGAYTATLIITTNQGCRDTVAQTFTVNGSVPVAGFTVQNPNGLCSNQNVSINDASTVDFGSMVKVEIYWDAINNPGVKETDDLPIVGKTYSHIYSEFGTPATKTYSIRYVAYSGINCVNTITRTVTVLATPALRFDPVNAVCANDLAFQLTQAQLLNALPRGGVFTGSGISSGGLFNPAIAGPGLHTIRYTYTGTNGCTNYKEQAIRVFTVPAADAGPDLFMLDGGFTTLQGSGTGNTISYLWTPNTALNNNTIAQPVARPSDDTYYTLIVTSADGCKTSDGVFVKVLKAPVIPNIFSPNGDGIHDKWVIEYLESYPGCTVEIYNRYGQMVQRYVNYTNPWDGKINGRDAPLGTYYYIIDPKNGRKPITGFVDIIR